MSHSGKASRAGWKIILWTLVLLIALFIGGAIAQMLSSLVFAIFTGLVTLWILFVLFTLYFFRDPEPLAPTLPQAIVAPAHGKVDVIEEDYSHEYMGGNCQRISIFLSIFDVHVQNAPVSGQVICQRHQPGKFLSATRTHSAEFNENVFIGLQAADFGQPKIGLKLIAGLIARRILPWINTGDTVSRSQRISLIQFGSRVELYLPASATLQVKLGDKVKGGETIIANFK